MKKRILCAVLALTMALSLPCAVSASELSDSAVVSADSQILVSGNFQYIMNEDNTATLTRYSG